MSPSEAGLSRDSNSWQSFRDPGIRFFGGNPVLTSHVVGVYVVVAVDVVIVMVNFVVAVDDVVVVVKVVAAVDDDVVVVETER